MILSNIKQRKILQPYLETKVRKKGKEREPCRLSNANRQSSSAHPSSLHGLLGFLTSCMSMKSFTSHQSVWWVILKMPIFPATWFQQNRIQDGVHDVFLWISKAAILSCFLYLRSGPSAVCLDWGSFKPCLISYPAPSISTQTSHQAASTPSLRVLLSEQAIITSFHALAGFLAQQDGSTAKFCMELFMGLSLHAP